MNKCENLILTKTGKLRKCICKFCKRQWNNQNYQKNRDRLLAKAAERLTKYPEKAAQASRKHKYGINADEFAKMLIEQDNKCKICSKEIGHLSKMIHVDHCHITGIVRGLLCHNCNVLLGHAKDDPEILSKALKYLIDK